MEAPSAEEVSTLPKEFHIHSLVAEELISQTLRSKVDIYKENIYLILHFPVFNPVTQTNDNCEIDFVIGKDFLVTAQYGTFDAFEEFVKNAKRSEEIRNRYFHDHAGFLVFYILKDLYDFSLRQLDHIHLKINRIENQIFNDSEKEMVKKISFVKRDILDFRRTTQPHDAVLNSFEKIGDDFFGKAFVPYLSALVGDHAKVKSLTEAIKETVEALYLTNESLLSIKTNEVMKTLTIMAFITFPITMISSIFSMNTVGLPIIGIKGDFWIVLSIMLFSASGILFFFKKKRWL